MENQKSKIEGWRKLSIGIFAIGSLTTFKSTIDFKIAVIIGIIAIVGMLCLLVERHEKKPPKID